MKNKQFVPKEYRIVSDGILFKAEMKSAEATFLNLFRFIFNLPLVMTWMDAEHYKCSSKKHSCKEVAHAIEGLQRLEKEEFEIKLKRHEWREVTCEE